jgi:hypothetical protein
MEDLKGGDVHCRNRTPDEVRWTSERSSVRLTSDSVGLQSHRSGIHPSSLQQIHSRTMIIPNRFDTCISSIYSPCAAPYDDVLSGLGDRRHLGIEGSHLMAYEASRMSG